MERGKIIAPGTVRVVQAEDQEDVEWLKRAGRLLPQILGDLNLVAGGPSIDKQFEALWSLCMVLVLAAVREMAGSETAWDLAQWSLESTRTTEQSWRAKVALAGVRRGDYLSDWVLWRIANLTNPSRVVLAALREEVARRKKHGKGDEWTPFVNATDEELIGRSQESEAYERTLREDYERAVTGKAARKQNGPRPGRRDGH